MIEEIHHPAEGINQALFVVVGHGIDREVAAGQIFPDIPDKGDTVRMPAVGVAALRAERRDDGLCSLLPLLRKNRCVPGFFPVEIGKLHRIAE